MSAKQLSTIGYEGASLDDFVETLLAARVTLLVDIRERAQSRRKGFSKSALEARINAAGISYLHLRELGDPKEGREAARAGAMATFRRIYASVLKSTEAMSALDTIEKAVSRESVCLLCYERDFKDCHRKLVSDKIESRIGCKTRHLEVKHFGKASSLQR
jgi:uncharacterized protein (DUF488 family)